MAKIQGNLTLIGDNFDTAYVSRMIGQFPLMSEKKQRFYAMGNSLDTVSGVSERSLLKQTIFLLFLICFEE